MRTIRLVSRCLFVSAALIACDHAPLAATPTANGPLGNGQPFQVGAPRPTAPGICCFGEGPLRRWWRSRHTTIWYAPLVFHAPGALADPCSLCWCDPCWYCLPSCRVYDPCWPPCVPAPNWVPSPQPIPNAAPPAETISVLENSQALLELKVPADAQVWIQGMVTRSQGTVRMYRLTGLPAGAPQQVTLQVAVPVDGSVQYFARELGITRGEQAMVRFDPRSAEGEGWIAHRRVPHRAHTELLVHLPDGARLTLAGQPVVGRGTTWRFTTDALHEGETWNDYPVCLEWEQHGQIQMVERRLTISGGARHELDLTHQSDAVFQSHGRAVGLDEQPWPAVAGAR